jgi:hypothetical protein
MTFTSHGTIQLAKVKGVCATQKLFSWGAFSHICQYYSFIFIEFHSVDEANLALASLHNHPFDAKHIFKLNRFTDIEKYAGLDEAYVEPEAEEFTPKASMCFQESILW